MQLILAYLPQIMQYAPMVVAGAQHFWAWIISIREAAKQSGEWTPEHEAAFVKALIATATEQAYLPDSALPQAPTIPTPGSATSSLPAAATPVAP